MQPEHELKDEKAAAQYLQVSPGTLQVWRSTRRYPLPFVKIGRNVRYRLADLQAFLQSRTVGGADQ
jgi:excisionase family DNA binding protein